MLRVNEFEVSGFTSDAVTQVMQDAGPGAIAEAGFAAAGAWKVRIVATPSDDLCFGEILGARDALGGVREILAGTRHGDALLCHGSVAWNLRHLLAGVTASLHALVLKTLFSKPNGR